MPNLKSSIKRAKQNTVRRSVNLARRSALKTSIKKVLTAISAQENIATIKGLLKSAEAEIARAKNKGVLHRNTAMRTISRLAKRVAAQEKTAAKAA